MMEYGDRGIKDSDDLLACLADGASAVELLQSYGERAAGLVAEALDKHHATMRGSHKMTAASIVAAVYAKLDELRSWVQAITRAMPETNQFPFELTGGREMSLLLALDSEATSKRGAAHYSLRDWEIRVRRAATTPPTRALLEGYCAARRDVVAVLSTSLLQLRQDADASHVSRDKS